MERIKIKTLNSDRLELIKSFEANIGYYTDMKEPYWFISTGEKLNYDFGVGKTREDAIQDLCSSIKEFYYDLRVDQDRLGRAMQKVWDYMQTIIREK